MKNFRNTGEDRCTVLLIEDDPDDCDIVREAFNTSGVPALLVQAEHGEQGLALLREGPLPALILLDLNMPVMDGREVLGALKSHPRWRRIPVVVLTTSWADDDVDLCYQLGGSSYITKPASIDDFQRLVHLLKRYWLEVVELPTP